MKNLKDFFKNTYSKLKENIVPIIILAILFSSSTLSAIMSVKNKKRLKEVTECSLECSPYGFKIVPVSVSRDFDEASECWCQTDERTLVKSE